MYAIGASCNTKLKFIQAPRMYLWSCDSSLQGPAVPLWLHPISLPQPLAWPTGRAQTQRLQAGRRERELNRQKESCTYIVLHYVQKEITTDKPTCISLGTRLTHARTYIRMHAHTHTHTRTRTWDVTQPHTGREGESVVTSIHHPTGLLHARTHARTHTHTHTHACTHTHTHTHMQCTFVHVFAHVHTHTHTHTHTQIHSNLDPKLTSRIRRKPQHFKNTAESSFHKTHTSLDLPV